jgi:hypothetical protein
MVEGKDYSFKYLLFIFDIAHKVNFIGNFPSNSLYLIEKNGST